MTRRCYLTLASVLLCLLAPALVLARPSARLATAAVDHATVSFEPQIPYSELRVTVSGPGGFEIVKVFAADQAPVLELPGDDGFYKFELRFSPVLDEEARRDLATARRTGNLPDWLKSGFGEAMVQSGSFSIVDGSAVKDLPEIEPKVVLTNGDGVIRNSLCVGFDCPDSPVFSDSTILMMENNTRIKFGDTSNSPFPNNDWEIEANSSLNGGANYLGFNDCGTVDNDGGCATDLVFAVEAGARQSALYVESDGDIGVGTSNPAADVHVVTGNSPTLRLDQDGSSGFTPQVWDLAGNEVNFFVRDLSGGSLLPLRIRPGAPTSSIDVQTDGSVQFGGESGAGDADLHVQSAANKDAIVGLGVSPDFNNGNSNAFVFGYNGNAGEGEGFIGTRPSPGGDGDISFFVENVLEMKLSSSGLNLTAGNDFSVNGVALNVPDFVFAEEYPLMPIDDLAAFVATEKHLPGIPSEEEIKGGGLGLGGFQMKLLEKIEELTLYAISQQGEIEAMRQRSEKLEADNAELKALVQQLLP